jgi:mono/diheme cytochrome c family protein
MKHKITVGGKDDLNPIPASEANIADGREHFAHHCASCHGLDGQATGVPFADSCRPRPFAFGKGQLKWIIENGINPSGMPAWKGSLSDEEMWKVVDFLRNLPPKGSLGIPDVYREEQKEHENMHRDKHN